MRRANIDVSPLAHFGRAPRCDIAIGDLDDLDSLTAAASGVDGIFYMQVNPGTAPAENIVAAARAAHVPKIVALSSLGARLEPVDHPIGADLAAREAVLRESGLDVTYLRPNAFMSNARSGGFR